MPANDPCASRVIVNVPIKTSRYRAGPREYKGEGDENVDVIKFPFRSSLRFATTDGKKEDKERKRERERSEESGGSRGERGKGRKIGCRVWAKLAQRRVSSDLIVRNGGTKGCATSKTSQSYRRRLYIPDISPARG